MTISTDSANLIWQSFDKGKRGEQGEFDLYGTQRDDYVWRELQRRQSEGSSSGRFELLNACWRYYTLLAHERSRLAAMFTPEELATLCDGEATPYWHFLGGDSLEGIAKNGWRPMEDGEKPRLMRKLAALTPAQHLAVADVCERIWRGMGQGLDFGEAAKQAWA